MSSRKIEDCVIELQEKWPLIQVKAMEKGIGIMLTCTARSALEQRALYAQGREAIEMVNHLRDNAGLPNIGDHENRKVTWTLDSKHIINDQRKKAEALDFAVVRGKQVVWDLKADVDADGVPDYEVVAEIGESLGLRSGARFSTPDFPHLEIT
jgi:hypothetical protein